MCFFLEWLNTTACEEWWKWAPLRSLVLWASRRAAGVLLQTNMADKRVSTQVWRLMGGVKSQDVNVSHVLGNIYNDTTIHF